jgi:two-component system, LytTR family, response regulator
MTRPLIRTVVADDVRLAREALKVWLNAEADVDVVCEASNGPDAVDAIRTYEPDLVFLDVKMPGLDGFAVLKRVTPGARPVVIFTTAHERYAVKAFEAEAVDYLLKPIDRRRFARSLSRARARLGRTDEPVDAWEERAGPMIGPTGTDGPAFDAPEQSRRAPQTLAVKSGELTLLIRLEEVEWIGAADNYAVVHSKGREFLVRSTVSALEQRLGPPFIRVSRSALVNRDRIHGFRTLWHGDVEIHLRSGTTVRLSRRYRHNLPS